jgi:PEP-CTERM motif
MTRATVTARLLKRGVMIVGLLLTASAVAVAAPINTNDINVYKVFATGATVQNFENIGGTTPLDLSSYANTTNSSTAVPAAAQLSLDINGLLFHSGGGSFNDPTGNPGTPTALLSLSGGLAGDAHSTTNVVGPEQVKSDPADPDVLDLDGFIEIVFINSLQSRAGVWLNPSLGNVLFTAFDSTGAQLEQFTGTAGNFVGVDRPTADVKFLSIISLSASGFTVDDLTYAGSNASSEVPEPGTIATVALGLVGLIRQRRRAR